MTRLVPTTQTLPFVSVIIPYYNHLEPLRMCLHALHQQSYPASRYEVIVVDNSPEFQLSDWDGNGLPLKILHEPKPGSYSARNTGIAHAQGDIFAFTDSDCVPDSNWIANAVKAIEQTDNCGLVGGRVDIFYKNPKRPTAVELYERVTAFPQDKYISKSNFSVTANMITTREVIEQVGLFNSDLKSGGDKEWGQRVYKAGFKLYYQDAVVVSHPARHTWSEIYYKSARLIGGQHIQRRSKGQSAFTFLKTLARKLVPLRYAYNICKDSKLNNLSERIKVFGVFMFVRLARFLEGIRLELGGQPRR